MNRAVSLLCRQVLGVENRRARLLRRLQDESVPKRSLVTRLDFERLNRRLWTVHHNLPTEVVLDQAADLVHRKRRRYFAPQIDAKLLQHLRAQDALARRP